MPHTRSFLEQSSRRTHAIRRKISLRKIFVWVCAVVLIYGVILVFASLQVYAHTTDAMSALTRAKSEGTALHFETADQSLVEAERAFKQAKRFSPFLKTAVFLPFVGSSLSESDALLTAGLDVVTSLQSVSEIGQSVLRLSGLNEQYFQDVQSGTQPRVSFSDLSPQTKQLVLSRLEASSNQFSLLSSRLSLVQDELDLLSQKTSIGSFASVITSAKEDLAQTQSTIARVSLFTDLVPAFAGLGKTAHHLMLFLNNTELRPAGGFVGNFGIATVTNGSIDSIKTSDVYALDRLAEAQPGTSLEAKERAPFALQKYNATPYWYFRDANWSPDFSSSAQKMIAKYKEESSMLPPALRSTIPYTDSIDGVIAFTPTFAARILHLVGPITVSGQTFTSENITDKLEYQVEYGYVGQGIPEAQRKEVIGQLVDAVVEKMTDMPLSEWASVLMLMEDAFRTKQFFVYHTNTDVEKVLVRAGWSGNIVAPPLASDVQLVVDANLASLKTDPAVDRTIRYEIVKDANGNRIGRTSITYHHTGTFDWKTSRYRTYTRLYVPLGSELVRVTGSLKNDKTQNPNGDSGAPDVSSELGMTVFGAFIAIEPGATGTLTFEYKLADSVRAAIASRAYTLSVRKQAGAQNHALTLDLDFGKNVLRASPSEEAKEWGDTHYRATTILDQDKEFQIGL
ncbi:hypothetical protein A2318_02865 [Candidatus Uhrbacteria bacterium RIFOXYB2_FULL_45_11]|uniref:DUF4012 domain-containing protein n=1 Tax=Candidatus Uhrbacteria bacterium RIFOXYB2_FULL_45_11 TaxID=1802421 RepID=A0A1F7W1D7_9BACT|nr:MAG: hypothetical protein A2318_02865 [Candidatus Uhrbacteria bacterium RIFOXYB2_FULL_45_11]